MNSIFKNILGKHPPLTQEEIAGYVSQNLEPDKMHQVEMKMAENNLNDAAVEGYLSHPEAIYDLQGINKKWFTKHGNGSSGTWLSGKTIITGTIIITVVVSTVLFLVFYQPDGKEKEQNMPVTANNKPKNNSRELMKLVEEEIDIAKSTVIPEKEQITYEKTKEAQPKSLSRDKNNENEDIHPENENKTMNNIPIGTLPVDSAKKKPAPVKKTCIPNHPAGYLHDLKVVDYRNRENPQIKHYSLRYSGVPAKYHNYEAMNNDETTPYNIEFIPYPDFLEQAIIKFKNNLYKDALKDFRTILQQFPDDQNACFYGGLCYYNIRKSGKAIECFNNIIQHHINIFHQEARFYKTLSLIQDNRKSQAEKILHEIIKENEFYAERAKQILSQIQAD